MPFKRTGINPYMSQELSLKPFYKPFESGIYPIKDFLQDYEELFPFVMIKLEEILKVNDNGFCFPLLVQNNGDLLHITSLIPIKVLNNYEKVIPDNDFNYTTNLHKVYEINKIIEVDIELISKKLKILIPVTQFVFQQTMKETIEFPEDYFLKGYPLLTEQLSKQLYITKPNIKNNSHPVIRAITINHLKNT